MEFSRWILLPVSSVKILQAQQMFLQSPIHAPAYTVMEVCLNYTIDYVPTYVPYTHRLYYSCDRNHKYTLLLPRFRGSPDENQPITSWWLLLSSLPPQTTGYWMASRYNVGTLHWFSEAKGVCAEYISLEHDGATQESNPTRWITEEKITLLL